VHTVRNHQYATGTSLLQSCESPMLIAHESVNLGFHLSSEFICIFYSQSPYAFNSTNTHAHTVRNDQYGKGTCSLQSCKGLMSIAFESVNLSFDLSPEFICICTFPSQPFYDPNSINPHAHPVRNHQYGKQTCFSRFSESSMSITCKFVNLGLFRSVL
jgi:hypothetical protein